jgi:hypothetical protein
MKNTIKTAKEMIKMGLVSQSSENYYEVDGEVVRLIRKPGRVLMTCSCSSCSRNINEPNNMCSRKIAVVLYQAQDLKLKNLIRTNMEYFRECESVGIAPEVSVSINLLNDLRGFIL